LQKSEQIGALLLAIAQCEPLAPGKRGPGILEHKPRDLDPPSNFPKRKVNNMPVQSRNTPVQPNAKAAPFYERGNMAVSARKFDWAIPDLTEAIQLDPDFAGSYLLRAVAFGETGDNDGLIADATTGIELEPDESTFFRLRARGYANKGDHEKAIADLTEAIRLYPKDAGPYHFRAIEYSKIEEWGKAIADFTKAIRRDPKNAFAYHGRGLAYEKKGNKAKAAKDFDQAKMLGYDVTHGVATPLTEEARSGEL
jgi:tetratricopeptide (TPR) repeat protein